MELALGKFIQAIHLQNSGTFSMEVFEKRNWVNFCRRNLGIQISCGGPHFLSIPERIPDFFETLVVRNASIRSLTKFAFRKSGHLKEIRFEHCNSLHNIEKLAFKSMKSLRSVNSNLKTRPLNLESYHSSIAII